jgi:hypothetical protein
MILTGTFNLAGDPTISVDIVAAAYENAGLSVPPEYPDQHWYLQRADTASVSLEGFAATGYPLPGNAGSVTQYNFPLGNTPHLRNHSTSTATLYYILVAS